MKRSASIVLIVLVVLLTAAWQGGLAGASRSPAPDAPQAGAPTVVSYQGQVTVGGVAYSGTGYFKFAIVDSLGTTTHWSNDGSTGNVPPTKAVQLTVASGLFNVLLGDTALSGMTALPASAFAGTDRWLRVWFNNTGPNLPFTLLTPDRRIAAAPYALQADEATNAAIAGDAEKLDGLEGSAYQLRVSGACATGNAIRVVGVGGAVTCEADDNTTYSAGTGLTLAGTIFSADTTYLQQRVSGACAVGSTIRAVNADGTVTCELDAPLRRSDLPQANVTTTADTAGTTGYVGEYTSITIGADGLPVVSYYANYPNYDLKVLHCDDAACTNSTATTVDATGDVGQHTSITIGADGLPVISYYDATNADLKVLHCGNAACTSSNTITTGDATGNVGRHTSITIGADGLPVVSYWENTNRDLKVLHCGDAACATGNTITTVDATGYVGEYTSIAIGADGLPVVSYYDDTNRDLKVLHCADAACTSSTATTVDTTGIVGVTLSITIGADGLPVVSYQDYTDGDLKVLHCGDAACTSSTATTVDATESVGWHNSITIGADGLPVVSYYDATNGDLKMLHCGDITCTTGNTATTVDATGYVGNYNSISIGADGLPVVSYYDTFNQGLKVLHCSNVFCVPYWRRR